MLEISIVQITKTVCPCIQGFVVSHAFIKNGKNCASYRISFLVELFDPCYSG